MLVWRSNAIEEVWVSTKRHLLRELAPGVVLEAVGVKALRGCESVSDIPLAAFNWWTVVEPEANAAYTAVVDEEAKIRLRQPRGTTPETSICRAFAMLSSVVGLGSIRFRKRMPRITISFL